MPSLYRHKRTYVISTFVLMFLVWLYINHRIHKYRLVRLPVVSDSFAKQKSTSASREDTSTLSKTEAFLDFEHELNKRAKMAIKKSKSINAASIALMLKGIDQKLKELIKFYDVKTPAKAVSTTKRLPTAKPSIDIVNDYYPFVDFKFVFPEIFPNVKKPLDIFMIILVNSGAKGEQFRKRREAIRETWGNRSSCEQRKALGDDRLKDLTWLLVFVVGKAGPGTNDDELNKAEAIDNTMIC